MFVKTAKEKSSFPIKKGDVAKAIIIFRSIPFIENSRLKEANKHILQLNQ